MTSRTRVLLCAAFVLVAFAPPGLAQTITEFPAEFANPFRIATGPDGALWFTTFGERVGRITTAGVVTYFSVPGAGTTIDITTGPDGSLWFTFGNTDDAFPHASEEM